MKKKKTLYMMLPLVVLVWGFVFYQLFGSVFSSPNYAKEEFKPIVNVEEIKKDSFLIVADYRDPFLGGEIRIRTQSSVAVNRTRKSTGVSQSKTPKTDKAWPVIIYKGMIKNNNSERRVGILSVAGREYLIKEKDVVSEITILSISKNKVSVRFQKENKTIIK